MKISFLRIGLWVIALTFFVLNVCGDIAHATGSTINTTVPAANSALQSAPIRANFTAAANDINGLIGLNNGTGAPASPILGQLWLNTSATPYVLNVWDGSAWDQVGTLNSSTNKWAVPIAQGGTGLTAAGTSGCVLTSTGSIWVCSIPTNTGTVTSVGLLLPSAIFNVTGSPVTTSGTFAASLQTQAVNSFFAGPSSGGSAQPSFRVIVPTDIPTLNQNTTGTAGNVTGVVAAANGGTGLSTCSTNGYVLTWNGSAWVCSAPTAGGTVTSVGLTLPLSVFSVSGSPVMSSGTLTGTLNTEPANSVWAGPTTGSAAQPSFRSLVGADLPTPGASALGGVLSATASSNQFATGINTLGALTFAQPAFSNISGVAANSQIPTPTSSALGGIESIAAVSHQWINSISTAGVPNLTQPAFSDVSGAATCSQLPALTSDVTTSAGSCSTTVGSIGGKAVSLAGAFTMSGAFGFTGTVTNTTSVTFPTSGTLATTANLNTALPSTSSLYKGTGAAGVAQAAVSGTDYAPATSGTSLLKANGSGGFSAALNSDLPAMSATVGGAVPTPPNNTTTFLRGDGTFAIPSTSGGMVLISTQTASSSANLSWTGITSAYLRYQLVCNGLYPSSADTLSIQIGEGGTPTWDTSNYAYQDQLWPSSTPGTVTGSNSISASAIALHGNQTIGTAATSGSIINAYITNPASTTAYKTISGEISWAAGTSSNFTSHFTGAYTGSTNAMTALRIQFSSSNIVAGSCSLFGIAN
jgi:hypothetical protein